MTLIRRLADAARAHPRLLVVIKVRARIESLLELRGSTGLRSYLEMSRSWLNRLRLLFYRHVTFAPERGTQRDLFERPVLALAHWINRGHWEALHLVRRLGN